MTTPEQMRQFRIRHRERLRLNARQYRKDNKAAISERRRAHYKANAEEILRQLRVARAANPKRQSDMDKRYREKRKLDAERMRVARKRVADYQRNRRHTDELYRITNNIRSRINGAIRYQNGKRAFKTIALIGTSVALLRTWIASQFKQGMSWENYGEWQIDHIIPCVEFDLTQTEQQKQCFHHSNLQPLWKPENISKGRKILTKITTSQSPSVQL